MENTIKGFVSGLQNAFEKMMFDHQGKKNDLEIKILEATYQKVEAETELVRSEIEVSRHNERRAKVEADLTEKIIEEQRRHSEDFELKDFVKRGSHS